MVNRSTFPTSIDSFLEHMEMSASDKPLVQRYQELKLKSNRTPMEDDELATLSTQLRNVLMTAEDFNKLQDAISNTQLFFRDSVDGYIQTKQTEFQSEVDKFTYKGEYIPTIQYFKKNTITYNNEAYLCLQDLKGISPDPNTNTSYWAKISKQGAKGEQGASGLGLSFKGAWNSGTQYYVNEAVQYGGQIFGCLQNNTGQIPNPSTDTQYWALVVAKGQSTVVTTLKNSVTVSNNTSNVLMGIPEFNSVTDSLIVIKNTATLADGINYQLNTNGISIDSLEGVWEGTEYPITFHFIVLKNMATNLVFSDGNLIQDGTVAKTKLKQEVQDEINKIASLSEGTIVVHKDEFVATEGQKLFTLSYTYDQFQNRTDVIVGGVPQKTPENYEETTSNSITLSEGVSAGTIIEVKYFSQSIPLQSDIQTAVDNHTTTISDHSTRLNNHDTTLTSVNSQLEEKAKQSDVNISLALKVDKVTGKALSTNDYDNTEKAEVAKVSLKADKTYVDTLTASIASGSPKGTYATLSALQTAFPTGNTNIYVVSADGNWYYWNGSSWTAGGVYQSTAIGDKTVIRSKLSDNFAETLTLTANTDLNTIKNEGNYWKDSAVSLVNAPTGISGKSAFISVRKFGTISIQTVYDYSNSNIFYIRSISDSTQRTWQTFNSTMWDVFQELTSGITLSTITQNGKYLGSSTDTFTDLPSALTGLSFMMNVEVYGSSKSFIIQTLTQTNVPNIKYTRYVRDGIPTSWFKFDINEFDVHVTLTSGVPLSDVTKVGTYLGLSTDTFSDRPNGLNGVSFMFKVEGYGVDRDFILQTATQTNTPENSYTRYLRNGVTTPWLKNFALLPQSGKLLTGKKIVCFGDSITEFGNYPDIIAEKTGATTYNVGFGGCRMADVPPEHFRYKYNEMSMVSLANTIATQNFTSLDAAVVNVRDTEADDNTAIVDRLKTIDFNTIDIITILYGTNDYTSEVPLGTDTDMISTTWKGAINLTVKRIMEAYPHIQIVFISPIWRARMNSGDGLESDTNPNALGNYVINYVDTLIERAANNKVPCLDFYRTSGINKYNETYMLEDGLHPTTPQGYVHVGGKIASYLSSVVG